MRVSSFPGTVSTQCDATTQMRERRDRAGVVTFTTGVTLRVGGAYSDSADGSCRVGSTCVIGVTDSDNSVIGLGEAVQFASPVELLKKTSDVLGNYVDAVKAGGFPIGDTIVAQECDPNVVIPTTVASDCDVATQISGVSGANGKVTFSTGVTLLVGGAYTDNSAGSCLAGGTCDIVVSDSANPSVGVAEAVSFATPTATASAVSNVAANALDKVTTGSFPIGDTVTAQECDSSVTASNVATNCDSATQITGTAGPSGKVAFTPNGVTIRVGSSYSDTAGGTCPPGGSCDVVIDDSSHTGFFIAIPIGLAS